MTIRDEARQEAERRYPALNPSDVELTYPREAIREIARKAFERGAVWASEQPDREPSDADSVTVSWFDCDCDWVTKFCEERHRRISRVPRALLAAQEVRRNG